MFLRLLRFQNQWPKPLGEASFFKNPPQDWLTFCLGVPREVDEDEETIKIVQLVKSQDALGVNNSEPIVGATIKVGLLSMI